jgi:CDP-diacylglycerol---serine O-phosphatidyltransferase
MLDESAGYRSERLGGAEPEPPAIGPQEPELIEGRGGPRVSLAVFPTTLTLANGVCGLAAIAVAYGNQLEWSEASKLFWAGLLIYVGMLFDAFDGQVARLTGQTTRFGAELDSLCDTITFGVAPTVILWRFGAMYPNRLTWAIGVLYTLCVLLRLARFNVEQAMGRKSSEFVGLPSPAAAGTVAAFAMALPNPLTYRVPLYPAVVQQLLETVADGLRYVVPLIAVGLSYLMVSRHRYPHLFQQLFGPRRSTFQVGRAFFAVLLVYVLHELVLPLGFCAYCLSPFAQPMRRKLAAWWPRRQAGDTA